MRKFIEESIGKLNDLYCNYEMYIWNHENVNLYILMQDNTINFTLLEQKEVKDEFILSFDSNEYNIFKYFCVRLMILIYGDVMIYQKENTIYNSNHRPNIHLIVNDEETLNVMKEIISLQANQRINSHLDIVNDLYDEIPFFKKTPNEEFSKRLDKRIDLSKKLLRR